MLGCLIACASSGNVKLKGTAGKGKGKGDAAPVTKAGIARLAHLAKPEATRIILGACVHAWCACGRRMCVRLCGGALQW